MASPSEPRRLSWRDRLTLWVDAVFMARLVPKDRVGPLLRPILRLPLLFRRIGLGILIPRNVLILTTTGRRSGRPHQTPVEFSPGPGEDVYLVMSGWDGHTDWYRNLCADPCVRVWLRGREWEARAERVPDIEVAALLRKLAEWEPASNRMWSRWAGVEMDGSEAAYLAAAPHFPSFHLWPAGTEGRHT